MEKLGEFVRNILEQKSGFKFEEPWKKSEKSLTVVVPIIRENAPERNYITLDEVKDQIEIRDSGEIDKIIARSNIDKLVFVRSGSLFKGRGTQSRGIVHSTVLYPNMEKVIEARCVHASHGIRPRAQFEYTGIAPITVRTRLVSQASQSTVWQSIYNLTGTDNLIESYYAQGTSPINTDRVDGSYSVKPEKIEESLEGVPVYENQVGVVIADVHGIAAFEVYDNPKSWVKFHLEAMGEIQDDEPLYTINENVLFKKIREFLEGIINPTELELVDQGDRHKVYKFWNGKYVGEYTEIDSRIVHIIVTRVDEDTRNNHNVTIFRPRIFRELDFLEYINDRTTSASRTWYSTPSTSTTQSTTYQGSTKTFSRMTSTLTTAGLIEKSGRSYKLTENGKRVLYKMEDLYTELTRACKRAQFKKIVRPG